MERAEDDFPSKVHCVPEFGVEESESGGVAPESGNVACVGGEGLERGASVSAKEYGKLVESRSRRESFGEGEGGNEARREGDKRR
jgi:hypothetical protein